MGCGTSRCSSSQQAELFATAAKEMMWLCINQAISTPEKLDQIKISSPTALEQVRQMATNLRKVGGVAKERLTVAQGGVGASDAAKKASTDGGLLGDLGTVEKQLLGQAASFVDKAAQALGTGMGMAGEKAFQLLADGLDSDTATFENTCSVAARALIHDSKDAFLAEYKAAIKQLQVHGAVQLVRGDPPHGPAQYKACKGDAVTAYFNGKCSTILVEKLLPLARSHVSQHKVTEDWNNLKWKYDQANQKLGEFESSKELVQGPLEVDLPKHIVEQMVPQLATLMAAEEPPLRAEPAGKGKKTFEVCFSLDLDGQLTLSKNMPLDYYHYKQGID